MADNSAIEWTEATWNPVTGCDKVRRAARTATRRRSLSAGAESRATPTSRASICALAERLEQPLNWKRSRMIFVNSMSDLFHERMPDEFIEQVFDVMEQASSTRFQILTKRHERLAELAPTLPWAPNVWMGVTHREPALRAPSGLPSEVAAAVRLSR